MIPPVFTILNADNAVKALLGSNPLRVFPWGEAPPDVQVPYATYGVFNANPQNTMDGVPQVDILGTQIDVWGKTVDSVKNCAVAIRNALETQAHMVGIDNSQRDPETKLFRSRMDFDFFTNR